MNRKQLLTWATTAALALLASASGSGQSKGSYPPIAIDIASDNKGIVLDSYGTAVEFDAGTGRRGRVLFQAQAGFTALDAAAANASSGVRGCISLYSQSSGRIGSWLVQLSQEPIWNSLSTRGPFAGCAIDSNAKRAYIVSSSGEILAVAIGDKSQPKHVMTIDGVDRLGPIALNGRGDHLVAADTRQGVIYDVNLPTGEVVKLATMRGADIRAVAVDRMGNVYIADSSKERIWRVRLGQIGSISEFSAFSQLREPTGLAVDASGRVWVCDQRARKLFRLSADGATADQTVDW